MADVLLTVSGIIPATIEEEIAAGRRPQADYLAMARAFDADLLDYAMARRITGAKGRALEHIGGPNLMLALACYMVQGEYRLIFTDGEQVGIPLAGLWRIMGRKQAQHFMIAHILSVGKKMRLIDRLRPNQEIDHIFVYSSWQKQFIQERWAVKEDRLTLTPFMVDADFFAPRRVSATIRPMICAVGLEFRDYPTLIRAVEALDIEVVIAAASPWSKRADSTAQVVIPPNVTVQKFSQYDLRRLYAESLFTVMPLEHVQFQAGVTAILEAMAMERAVICTRTPGQTDVVIEGETGLYVPPQDSAALRYAIEGLLEQPDVALRMGQAGRRRVLEGMSLDCYADRLASYVRQTLPTA